MPETAGQGTGDSVQGLLHAAAIGHIGVDRRFIAKLLEQENAAAGALEFSRQPHDQDRIDLDPLLVDLFRHFQSPEALDFYIDAIRRAPEDVDDSLIQALLPFGENGAEALLHLYDELDEEQGSDIAFLLAALRVRDPRVRQVLLDRLEYDAADGAFCLGLYGDPETRPALEKLLTEVPETETTLRREIQFALEQLDAPEPQYKPEPFDILEEYPAKLLPPFDVLDEAERLEMLASPDAEIRAGAAHSFFNQELDPQVKTALLKLAQDDPEAKVRGEAWASLGDATEEDAIRTAMAAVLNDPSRPVEERGGAAVGLYAVADRKEIQEGIEALYAQGGKARIKALEAMWRSLWQPYAKYFPAHLDETDPEILRPALRGAGYFRLTRYADKIASFFDREEPYDELRDDALFAYALAMPGETTRGRVRGMLRKIDALAKLSPAETDLVMFALDERLRLHGLAPVFEEELNAEIGESDDEHEGHDHHHDHAGHDHSGHDHSGHDHSHAAQPAAKVGRNDPCPCGSGKKYKKCHGA